jgi:hypothetical protein
MLEHLLSLPCSMLEATCRPVPQDADEDGAFKGPLWDVHVPHSKPLIPFILDFARMKQTIHLDVNARRAATLQVKDQPTAGTDGLLVPYEAVDVYGKITKAVKSIPFLHPKAESLFSGQWTTFGPVQVRFDFDCILPDVTYSNGNAYIAWKSPPTIRSTSTGFFGLRQKITTTTIKHFRISEFDGEVVTTSRLRNLILPDAVWS